VATRVNRQQGRPRRSARPEAQRGERLQKFLARAGAGSRRQCEEFIAAGRVQVNGEVVGIPGTRVRPGVDRVQVDGVALRAEAPLTVMLHKPAGYITAVSDPEGRPVVLSLLPKTGLPRLFPVGRLDWDTEGLLLLTNDGDLANLLTHPRHGVSKVYHAKVKGRPTPEALRRLLHGVVCDGERLSAAGASLLRTTRENAWVVVSVHQGRYRQVRRMCEAIGHPVLKLVRVALGPLTLGPLPRGQWRPLFPAEFRALEALKTRAAAERS
jgi:pseudouridine synthase